MIPGLGQEKGSPDGLVKPGGKEAVKTVTVTLEGLRSPFAPTKRVIVQTQKIPSIGGDAGSGSPVRFWGHQLVQPLRK